jgi:hypothetical protein
MTAKERYPELWTLIGAWLHQDWPHDSGTVEQAMRSGLVEANIDQVVSEIDGLTSGSHQEEALHQLGCEVHLPFYGVSAGEFFVWLKVFARMQQRERAQKAVQRDGPASGGSAR